MKCRHASVCCALTLAGVKHLFSDVNGTVVRSITLLRRIGSVSLFAAHGSPHRIQSMNTTRREPSAPALGPCPITWLVTSPQGLSLRMESLPKPRLALPWLDPERMSGTRHVRMVAQSTFNVTDHLRKHHNWIVHGRR